MDELTARGGIGEILGRFIDAQGDVVDSEIATRSPAMISIEPLPRIAAATMENINDPAIFGRP